jgi:hypothetical protein
MGLDRTGVAARAGVLGAVAAGAGGGDGLMATFFVHAAAIKDIAATATSITSRFFCICNVPPEGYLLDSGSPNM